MLIHAGSGAVGHFTALFARYFGADVTATGSARNLDFLRELGADDVIDYRRRGSRMSPATWMSSST